MIKAIIFDLDDTLFDQTSLREKALVQALQAMIRKGLQCNIKESVIKANEIVEKNPFADKFEEIALYFGTSNERIIELGRETYKNAKFEKLDIYADVTKNLGELRKKYKLFLVSEGSFLQQHKKIDALQIREYFEGIFINEDFEKINYFEKIAQKFNYHPEEIMVIGDRIDKEISAANKLGMHSVRMLRGMYSKVKPRSTLEKPLYVIQDLSEVPSLINNKKTTEKLKIVAIGGGTGLPTIVEGLRKYTDNITMIVTVTDSGRSSGILRRELNILPPGDIRNCLIALSNSEKLMYNLFQYRFDNGSLNGHNFGNLFIAALTKLTGSFEKAIEETSKILKLKGKVLPSTLDNVHICAELENGELIEEENKIIDRKNEKVYLRSPIKKVFLKPSAKGNKKVLQSIKEADLIVLCPGSLFTSIITNLLVEGISETIDNSKAKKIYICNIMTQISQTYRYRASDHIKKILEYLNINLDYVILNNEKPVKELLDSYAKENAYLVENDINEIKRLGVKIITGNFLDEAQEKKLLWEKKNLLRHDPDKIARVLIGLVN